MKIFNLLLHDLDVAPIRARARHLTRQRRGRAKFGPVEVEGAEVEVSLDWEEAQVAELGNLDLRLRGGTRRWRLRDLHGLHGFLLDRPGGDSLLRWSRSRSRGRLLGGFVLFPTLDVHHSPNDEHEDEGVDEKTDERRVTVRRRDARAEDATDEEVRLGIGDDEKHETRDGTRDKLVLLTLAVAAATTVFEETHCVYCIEIFLFRLYVRVPILIMGRFAPLLNEEVVLVDLPRVRGGFRLHEEVSFVIIHPQNSALSRG